MSVGSSGTVETIKNFTIEYLQGEGSFGKVFLAKQQGNSYALKILSNSNLYSKNEVDKQFEKEVKNLDLVGDHKNLVKCYKSWSEPRENLPSDLKYAIHQSFDPMYIILMEYCKGTDLDKWLQLNRFEKTVSDAKEIILQICDAVIHLHSSKRGLGNEILHRDLKPANIFFYEEYKKDCAIHVKIGDFGLSRKMIQPSRTDGMGMTAGRGTPLYISPEQEILVDYTTKTDIYSMGLIFIEILTSTFIPVDLKEKWDIREKLYLYDYRRDFKSEHEFLLRLLSIDPNLRPKAEEVSSQFQDIWQNESSYGLC